MNKIIQGDCLEVMKTLEDNSIDLTVTSPPYDNLRTYNGYTFDFEGIARELFRVTKQGGVVVWVVGDATIKGSETCTSDRQKLYFKDVCGFNVHDTMIYEKNNPIPLTHNRYEQGFEFMFVFSKGKPRVFNPIKCKVIIPNRAYEWTTKEVGSSKRGRAEITFSKETKIIRNIWKYSLNGNRDAGRHPAPFPEKLAEDHILSWSNEGDTVLDPMAGSGTTLKMAKKNNRNYIGIEISEEYIDIINNRLSSLQDNK